MVRLTRHFFEQPTLIVARELIGAEIVITHTNFTKRARIIETEAYVGPEDLASHASRGLTKRTKPMFGPAGFTYLYLIYGMYWCLNIITEREDYPAAVLIRAVEPLEPQAIPKTASGPGKTCRWFGLDGSWNQMDACGDILYIEIDDQQAKPPISTGPRIGVAYAGQWAAKPWRFGWTNHPKLSRKF
ncbi:MAG: DNA-3-methyladenine glycosylase [Patescibacteria group bacterium]